MHCHDIERISSAVGIRLSAWLPSNACGTCQTGRMPKHPLCVLRVQSVTKESGLRGTGVPPQISHLLYRNGLTTAMPQ